jgi:hypothetical protein
MRAPSSFALLFAFVLAACGGIVADPGTAGTNGVGPGTGPGPGAGKPASGSKPFTGSYDVFFTNVVVSGGGGTAPFLTMTARLDIRTSPASSQTFEAALTLVDGEKAAYTVAVSDQALTFTNAGGGSTPTQEYGGSVVIASLVVARGTDGALGDTASASGTLTTTNASAVPSSAGLTATAMVVHHTTKPSLFADVSGFAGAAGGLLPWNPIVLVSSEPVYADTLQQTTRAVDASGNTLALRWDPPSSPEPAPWAGETRFVAHVADFTQVGLTSWSLQGPGATDLTGNASSDVDQPLYFVTLTQPRAQVGFDDELAFVHEFGTTALYGGGRSHVSDPRCEAGGCARLGPLKMNGCGEERDGFVTQLTRAALGRVALRYRVLAKPEFDAPTGQPGFFGDVLTVELASPDAAAVDNGVAGASANIVKLAAPIDGMTWGSDWTTLDLDSPGSGVIGFAVAANGARYDESGCTSAAPLPVYDVEILVESVTAE